MMQCKEKGCKARKYVEQTVSHPIQSRITYAGKHACVPDAATATNAGHADVEEAEQAGDTPVNEED